MPRLLQLALGVFTLTGVLFAQSEAGGATVTGTVTDPSGAAVTGAKVTLNSDQTGYTRVFETNASGLYNFARVPVGRYSLVIDKSGFKSVKRTDMDLTVGAMLTVDAALTVGSTSESITVSGDLPLVETTRSQTSTNVDERAVKDLPINGRNFLDFTLLTPGVNRDTRGGDLTFGGQRGTANSLLVDGMDSNNLFFGQSSGRAGVRNPYSFSQDAVEEFQVNTNGFAAEIGRAGGGVINVVTKSGTNTFHGNAFEFFRDRELNANTFINKSRGIVRQPYHYNQFGGTVGGPIKKDKIFFFLSYDGQRNLNPNPVFFNFTVPTDSLSQAGAAELSKYLTPYTTGYRNDIGLAKVDWNLSNTQRLSVRANIHRFTGINFENGGNQSAQEHTGNSLVSTNSLAVNYSKVFGSAVVFDSRFNWVKDDEPGEANSTAPETVVNQSGGSFTFGRNNFSPRYTNSKRYQFIESVSYLRGKHAYKIGGDLNFERIDNFFPGNFSGVYRYNSLADFAARKPFQFTQGFAGDGTDGPLTKPNIAEFAFFVQDAWRVTDRLTLNYGYRYDIASYAQPKVLNPDAGLAAQGLATNRINTDKNNHAPRFGFAYRLDDKGRQLLRGGYGIFYSRTPSILTGTAMSQNGIQVQTYTLSANLPTYPNILSAPPTVSRTPDIYVVAPNYVSPLTAQWNFNYEVQLSKDYAVTFGYLGLHGYHLSRTRDINLFPLYADTATYANGTPTVIYTRLANRPNANFGRISLFDSGADSIYHGAFVQGTKRFSRNFQLLASYTFSKVIDTVPDATSVVVGSDDGKVALDTLNPNNDRAAGDTNVKHRFVASGVWDLNYFQRYNNAFAHYILNGWQLSGIFNARSGQPYSATVGGNADINRDGNTRNDRAPMTGRNIYTLPSVYTLDARVTKVVPLYKESVRLRLVGEAFNLANRANVANVNRTPFNYNSTTKVFSPVAIFGTASTAGDPRILQIAAKIEF
ncbi:TonB-dependent receptor [Paludibaculum fermentans]|uniref:TonB-dependent receptor n=1 Tax=Paludibaculum fermentans TaxID=1473598 RepID=A0A7S7SKX4_PALFE|nr:carboxypeptidase regulatory-like domain-containing protein [Paludibaculum fermentans]QOY89632.1 TonB-dependent receptor [Paludibaculum fermentans]